MKEIAFGFPLLIEKKQPSRQKRSRRRKSQTEKLYRYTKTDLLQNKNTMQLVLELYSKDKKQKNSKNNKNKN
jgi:hypothetical protein